MATPSEEGQGNMPPPQDESQYDQEDGAAQAYEQYEGEDEEDGTLFDEAHELALIREFGAHPLMHRVQEALIGQLKQSHDRLREELRVRKEDLKKTKANREEVGVDLYGQQQQLARLQLMLESTHESLTGCAKQRVEVEVREMPLTL